MPGSHGSISLVAGSAEGEVYCRDLAGAVIDGVHSVSDLLALNQLGPRMFLVAGVPGNAGLIAELAVAGTCVYAASPALCRDYCVAGVVRIDPTHVERLPRRPDWVRVTARDAAAFALTGLLDAGAESQVLEAAARRHPAWAAVSFVPGFDVQSAYRVLAAITEPRWFCDPNRPDRLARLNAYLGFSGRARREVQAFRAEDVLRLWYYPTKYAPLASQFLWRAFVEARGGQRGRLVASRKLLRFIHSIWLDTVTDSEVFDPKVFFANHGDEAAEFAAHWEGVTRCLDT